RGGRAPRRDTVARRIGARSTLSTHREIEQRSSLGCRLAHMAAGARGGLFGGEYPAELRQDSSGPDRVVKELFSGVSLRLGDLEARIGPSVGEPRLRAVCIAPGHL